MGVRLVGVGLTVLIIAISLLDAGGEVLEAEDKKKASKRGLKLILTGISILILAFVSLALKSTDFDVLRDTGSALFTMGILDEVQVKIETKSQLKKVVRFVEIIGLIIIAVGIYFLIR